MWHNVNKEEQAKRNAKIVALHRSGIERKLIAYRLGVSVGTVSRIVKEFGDGQDGIAKKVTAPGAQPSDGAGA